MVCSSSAQKKSRERCSKSKNSKKKVKTSSLVFVISYWVMYYFPICIFLQKTLSARKIMLKSFYAEADSTPSIWCATEFPISFPLQVLVLTENTESQKRPVLLFPWQPGDLLLRTPLATHNTSTHSSALHSQILVSHRSYTQWLMLISLSHMWQKCVVLE